MGFLKWIKSLRKGPAYERNQERAVWSVDPLDKFLHKVGNELGLLEVSFSGELVQVNYFRVLFKVKVADDCFIGVTLTNGFSDGKDVLDVVMAVNEKEYPKTDETMGPPIIVRLGKINSRVELEGALNAKENEIKSKIINAPMVADRLRAGKTKRREMRKKIMKDDEE
ncbi:MAG: hypothetical protein WC595_00980 [Candidatus Nanoarchaeia archaeon]